MVRGYFIDELGAIWLPKYLRELPKQVDPHYARPQSGTTRKSANTTRQSIQRSPIAGFTRSYSTAAGTDSYRKTRGKIGGATRHTAQFYTNQKQSPEL